MAKKHQDKPQRTPAKVGDSSRVVAGVGAAKAAIGQAGRFSGDRNANRYTLAGRTAAAGRNFTQANATSRRMLQIGAKTSSLPKAARGLTGITKLETLSQSTRRMIDGFKAESLASTERFTTAGRLSSRLLRDKLSVKSLPQLVEKQRALDAQRQGGDAINEEIAADQMAREKARIDRDVARVFGRQMDGQTRTQTGGRGRRAGAGTGGGFLANYLRSGGPIAGRLQGRGRVLARGTSGTTAARSSTALGKVSVKTAGAPMESTGFDQKSREQVTPGAANIAAIEARIAPDQKSAGVAIDTTGFDQKNREQVTPGAANIAAIQARISPNQKSAGTPMDTTGFDEFSRQQISTAQANLADIEARLKPNEKSAGPEVDTTGFAQTGRGPLSLGQANLLQLRLRIEPDQKSAGPEIDTSGFAQTRVGSLTNSQARVAEIRERLAPDVKSFSVGTEPAPSAAVSWPSGLTPIRPNGLGNMLAELSTIAFPS